MLCAKNKETGGGLTDMQVVAQSNSFMIAGKLRADPASSIIMHFLCPSLNVDRDADRGHRACLITQFFAEPCWVCLA